MSIVQNVGPGQFSVVMWSPWTISFAHTLTSPNAPQKKFVSSHGDTHQHNHHEFLRRFTQIRVQRKTCAFSNHKRSYIRTQHIRVYVYVLCVHILESETNILAKTNTTEENVCGCGLYSNLANGVQKR